MGGRGVRTMDWVTALAGLLVILSLFLKWYESNADPRTGWQALAWVDKIVLICGLLAIGVPWFARMRQTPADAQRYIVVVAGWALFTIVVVAIRIAAPPKLNDLPISTHVRAGAWVGLVLAVAVLICAVLAMRSRVAARATTTAT